MTTEVFSYQNDAALVMAQSERLGLHDEMGIGKTATTIRAMNHVLAERSMIVVPAMLRSHWITQWNKFSTYPLRMCKARSVHDLVAWQRRKFDVLVCSYEHATKWTPFLLEHGEYIDTLAVDEAHYLKNKNSQRSKAILGMDATGLRGLTPFAAHYWHITGTPLADDPLDIYTFLRSVNALEMDQDTFIKTFFTKRMTAYGSRHFVKEDMLPYLQGLIHKYSIRRTHEDVGMWLPKIWMKEVLIDGDTSAIDEAIRDYPNLEDIIVYAIEMNDLSLLNAAHIATVRRLVGKAKAVSYAQMLLLELQAGAQKRVAYFVHTEPLLFVHNYLQKHGYRGVCVYGDTPPKQRETAVEQFMSDPSIDYFLGNMRVAGVGLTLTASSEIDVVESDWTPANNAQAIKRVHRYGQLKEVHARFITLADSIDEGVNKTVAEKTAEIAKIEGFSMAAAPLDVLSQ